MGGGSLVVAGTTDVFGTIEVVDPSTATLTLNGPVKVETSGVIEAIGSHASIYFSDSTAPAPGTYTVDNFGTILANQAATVWFQQGAVINEATGHIEAENGSLVVFETGNAITNLGLLEAVTGGEFDVKDSMINWAGATPSAGTNGILIGGSSSELLVDVTNLQLTGGGAVLLESGSLIYGNGSSGSPDTLENVDNTISGAGTIGHNGDGDLALTNDSTRHYRRHGNRGALHRQCCRKCRSAGSDRGRRIRRQGQQDRKLRQQRNGHRHRDRCELHFAGRRCHADARRRWHAGVAGNYRPVRTPATT